MQEIVPFLGCFLIVGRDCSQTTAVRMWFLNTFQLLLFTEETLQVFTFIFNPTFFLTSEKIPF